MMSDDLHLVHWLWLANALGFCASNAAEVLAAFETPEQLYAARRTENLAAFFTPHQLHVLQDSEPEDFFARLADCHAQQVHIIAFDDENYPEPLRQLATVPPVLYYRGDITLPGRSLTFAMIGTRRPSAYGVEATRAIAKPLAEAGVVLVSGLATGLDSETHKAAVQADTPTIACIAFGHDGCYPAANRTLKGLIEKQGLVLSEFPPGTKIEKQYFLYRNRMIAGIARGVCVAEARKASGTMNTVNTALELNRDVFAVPGSIFSALCEGTNYLLAQGANAATCADDILHFYGVDTLTCKTQQSCMPDTPPLSEAAHCVQKALCCTPQPLQALCAKTNLPPHKVMAALTELELAGISSQQAGRQFVLKH